MTKRDTQAREYAAESYEKPPAERGVSNTFDRLTDAERDAVRFCSVVLDMGERPDCAATLRNLLERLK
jgi:hypothetical protein